MIPKLALIGAVVLIDLGIWFANQINDLNVILNLATIAIAVAVAFPIVRSKRKDGVIADLKAVVGSKEQRLAETEAQLTGAGARADQAEQRERKCRETIAGLQGELTTLKQYAAPEAFRDLAETLGALRAVVKSGFDNQGELILKNTELASAAVASLELIVKDFRRLAERLGAENDRPLQP